MIEYVKITNHIGDSLVLTMTRPDLSGLVVESISGIGPGSANINITDMATKDGGLYNSSHINTRNITMSLICYDILNGNNLSIENSRLLTYKYFQIKKEIELIFKTDNRLLRINGYVEKVEPDIFSKTEKVNISILCPDPFFYALNENEFDLNYHGIENRFSFPFSNKSFNKKLIIFGISKKYPSFIIDYDGEYETGLTVRLHANSYVYNPKIIHIEKNVTMQIKNDELIRITGKGIVPGDEIIINTRKGKKSVILYRDGITTNIISSLTSYENWFELQKGLNTFTYDTDFGSTDLSINFKWETIYEGV